ncbi:MAG: TrpB-like pyridoxal phosphate-dependent enzyme [Thermoprotei archaeon]|nr:MAG: TrpB-like pyridoxal phosphate-dependent enzyme [Thermoprotei archaeon]RLF24099.1 MAG: TrpB-like pyridoxal phosphate-dependent enzyme [Thermoprotei archaeon]
MGLKHRVRLPIDEIPRKWYNIVPDLPEKLPPMLDPLTKRPIPREALERIFVRELVRQEFSEERFISIPDEVLEAYIRMGRPTPLIRARRLEEYLRTPAKIYYKFEGVSPTGSHKVNTAIAQAYYAHKEGVERLVTETSAGQWGSALALACAVFNLKLTVYMTRASYYQKPYRRVLMQLYGAEVLPSPSNRTKFGRSILERHPEHPGSLGIAISEAIEDVMESTNSRYSLGSVLNHVLLHQTIIGLEAKKQMELIDEKPDVIIACVGGGSNFAGLAYPFMKDRLVHGEYIEFIAAEPKACPSLTKGEYRYDFGDTAGLTPLIKMFTVGHKYQVPPIHAAGLRYHGAAPTLSLLLKRGYIKAIAYYQNEVFQAASLFTRVEGIVPAPESAHAVKAAIDIALKAKEKGEEKVILFNLSGHGLLDLKGYEEFLEGKLPDYEPVTIDLSYLP